MLVAPDRSSVTFRLNPKASFWNGDPVLAEDVKHSFEMLTGRFAAPAYRSALAVVDKVTVLDARTIRMDLRERTIDAVGTVATLPVFSRKWGLGKDGRAKNFDEIVTEYPITSGPYTIALTDSGRRIEFQRRADYWARDLGVRRGQFNFDRVVYRYYKDRAVSMEAFKAGEFDLTLEYSARRWDRQHAGPKWADGRIRKETFANGMGAGMQAYLFNLRRPIFQDRRTREAMDWAFDFEWVNRLRQYQRTTSMFSNSRFAAQGLPSPGELALLEPFRKELPPAVFGPPYVAPRTDTGPMAPRENLRRARDLLAQAGWKLGPDGVLHDAQGRALEFDYLTSEDGAERTVAVWQSNLRKLGVRMRVRRVDFALYRTRLERFDFDMVAIRMPDFTLPSAQDYVDTLGSKAADEPASGNYRGVKSAAVDALLAALARAATMQELQDACRALDRVVMHEHWQVPELYAPNFRVSYWDRFERPKTLPKYYTIDSPNDALPQWPLIAWWLKPAARR
jgi:peptide/nickel transport system substrate-binding protein/microcin C transport system substrate-binding protein